MKYWFPDVPAIVWSALFLLVLFGFELFIHIVPLVKVNMYSLASRLLLYSYSCSVALCLSLALGHISRICELDSWGRTIRRWLGIYSRYLYGGWLLLPRY